MKSKITEWVIFAILILVITHMTYGLDELGTQPEVCFLGCESLLFPFAGTIV